MTVEQTDRLVYEFISEVRTKLGVITERLDTLINHAKETNGRVHKLEIITSKLEREIDERDEKLEKLITQKEVYLKNWMLRLLLISMLLGSFLWIKESRDVILSFLKLIV
jgi:hypothetical protein